MVKQFTKDELGQISNIYKNQYWWDKEKFKNYLNTTYWEWTFDALGKSVMSSVENINKAPTATPTTPVTTPVWTQVNTNEINNSTSANTATTEVVKQNIEDTNKQQEDIKKQTEERIAEDTKAKEEAIKQAEEFAKRQEDLYKSTNEQVKSLENQMADLITQRQERDVSLLEEKKQSELNKLKAEQELQKYKDEQSIKEAQKAVIVSQQKANWAFNQLWVAFSSYAVNTTNRIATEWAEKIAWLKLQASANQTTFAKDISTLEFNYTKEINTTIDDYTNKSLDLKSKSIERIYNLQNNLLLNEKEKQKEIKSALEEYRNNVRSEEDNLYKEFERLRDKQLEQVKVLEQQITNSENTSKTKINDMILNWTWDSLSSIQKNEYLKKANMTEAEVNQSIKSTIYSQSYNLIQWTLWKDYLPSVAQMDLIQSEVDRMMLAWRSITEAINIATNRVIKSTPEYKASKIKSTSSWSSNKQTTAQILALAKINNLDISASEAALLSNLDNSTLNSYLSQMKENPNIKASDLQVVYDDKWYRKILNKITWKEDFVYQDTEVFWNNSLNSTPSYGKTVIEEKVKWWKINDESNNSTSSSNEDFLTEIKAKAKE